MILSFVSVISAQNNLPFFIDPYLYTFNKTVSTEDTLLTANADFASIQGGQVDVYIYQYPLDPGSDATAGAAVTIETTIPTPPRKYGRTSFSVDAAIYGFVIQVYDGIDTPVGNGNPCVGKLSHLNDDVACANAFGVASPGLQLDLSGKDYFATEILSQDIPGGANIIIRIWDNSGNTGYIDYIHSTSVIPISGPYKPLLIFPFSRFTNAGSIVWSNIRAFAVEFNSSIASVDLVIGPIQALGSSLSKSSPTSQPIQPNQQVVFKVDVFPDIYQTNVLSQLLTTISHNVTIVDTLPAEFVGFNTSSISVVDQNGTNIPVQTSFNGNTATFSFSFNNSQLPSLSYKGLLPSTYNFCSKTVCNNAVVTVVSRTGSTNSTKTSSVSTCVNLTSTQSISTNYVTCPTTFGNNLQYNASVCNNGNGVATNVNFVHTSSDSLSGCVVNFPSGSCNGATCSTNLGNLSAGQCRYVSFSYDCSSFAQTCTPLNFTSSINANESCSNTTSTKSCNFTFTPSSSNVTVSNNCPQNLTPSNTTTQHSSTVCNNGAGIARNVIYQFNATGALTNCTLNILGGTCNGGNCSTNLGDLTSGQCVNVAININCPTYAQTCTSVNFPSTYYATETCNGKTATQSCSFNLNPGTPAVTISNTCPQNLTPSNTTTQLSSLVCNNGTGIARNVVFNHTSSGALSNCTATLQNGICTGTNCSTNLGDLAVGQCVNVLVNFNCPSYAQTCTSVNFPSTVSATEGCGTPVTSKPCSFNLIPGTPSIRTTFNSCPSFNSNFLSSSVSHVCNNGTGIARNVVFNHTSSGALVNCTATLQNGTCNGAICSTNLGDFAVGQCMDVTVNYDCSVYSNECLVKTFSAIANVAEGCGSSNQQTSCTFSTNPSLQVKVSESLLNVAPARISENITWSINATNNGPATVKSFILQKTYPQYTYPTSQTLSNWSCGANNLCTYNGASLSSGQTISNILFSVQLLNNTPIGTSQVCNNLTMISQPNQTNCFSQDSTFNCAPVNPGSPDIELEKGVFASQYSFTIDYQNAGSGSINNLELQEVLQVGWKLNSALSTNGWKCGDSLCTFTIPSVAPSESGKVFFVVDVEESSQTDSQGMKKCWSNIVSSTFDDESFDPTPLNNQASAQIGSSCKECCDPAPCPTNVCNLTCPPPTVTVPCPVVTCSCKLPEYFCPPCQVNPPTCNCNQCSQTP